MKPVRKQLKARRWQSMQRAVSITRDGCRGHEIAAAARTARSRELVDAPVRPRARPPA
jgi:hypothetical protein